MSTPVISHDAAASLLNVSPDSLTRLVGAGVVRRLAPGKYTPAHVVRDYITFLQSEPERRERGPSQDDIAAHLDMSDRSVREVLDRLEIDHKSSTLSTIRVSYIRYLREVAAGRDPDGDLAAARTRLANESADRVALENAIKRREYAPHSALEIVLGDIARQIATRLDALVPQVRRVLPDLPASVIAQLSAEVAACRELCASANLRDADRLQRDDDEEDGPEPSETQPAGAAPP